MNYRKEMLQLHIAVLLFGVAGVFGKLLALSPITIVFGRVLFASIALYIALVAQKTRIKLDSKKDYIGMLALGGLLAFHWIAFFQSIQLSTVAIGLLTFSSFPIFVTFIEPLMFKTKLRSTDIVLSVITLIGVVLVIPKLEPGSSLVIGSIWGVLSGLSFAVLSLLNKSYTERYSGMIIAFYQDCSAAALLLPAVLFIRPVFNLKDILLLLILGVVFTGVSHSLFVSSLSKVKAHTASIAACLEPVYGILFGVLLIGELPTLKVLLGGAVIVGAAFFSGIMTSR